MFTLTTKYHNDVFFLHLGYLIYVPIKVILGEGGRTGILIAIIVLGMCILTQNGCPMNAIGASCLGGSRGMLPQNILKM